MSQVCQQEHEVDEFILEAMTTQLLLSKWFHLLSIGFLNYWSSTLCLYWYLYEPLSLYCYMNNVSCSSYCYDLVYFFLLILLVCFTHISIWMEVEKMVVYTSHTYLHLHTNFSMFSDTFEKPYKKLATLMSSFLFNQFFYS